MIQKLFLSDYQSTDITFEYRLKPYKAYQPNNLITQFVDSNSEKLLELYRLQEEGFYEDPVYLKMFEGNLTAFVPRLTFEENDFSICYHYPEYYEGTLQMKGSRQDQQLLREKLSNIGWSGNQVYKSKELLELEDLLKRYEVKYLKWQNGFGIQFDKSSQEYKDNNLIIRVQTYIDIIPTLSDNYFTVLRSIKNKMKKIGIVRCFAIVVDFNAKNISFKSIYDMFQLSDITLYHYDEEDFKNPGS